MAQDPQDELDAREDAAHEAETSGEGAGQSSAQRLPRPRSRVAIVVLTDDPALAEQESGFDRVDDMPLAEGVAVDRAGAAGAVVGLDVPDLDRDVGAADHSPHVADPLPLQVEGDVAKS